MFLSVLLLLVCGTQAYHFRGTMMTYYPKETRPDGSVSVILRYKLSYASCSSASWTCSGNCGTETQNFLSGKVDESSGDWCQEEGIMTRLVPNNSPLQLVLAGGDWIRNMYSISSWRAVTGVELRNRSDINKPNTSPQTTILPVVRVPLNCQRNISLLTFDPDGDEVRCRYGNVSLSECVTCRPPSVLNISSSSCSLSFSPTSSSNEGSYVVQLVMEDFPRQTITLTHTNGSQLVKTTSDAISKIPVQFVLKVDPAAPSCSEGLYLPRFLPPTPDHRAQLYISVNQTLEIPIRAEAAQSMISQLLFSGPYNVIRNTSGSGNFSLSWTPSDSEAGQSHPICFVVQATSSSSVFQSELRCLIVTVGNPPPTTPPVATTPTSPPTYHVFYLKMKITTTMSLDNNKEIIEKLIKDTLIGRGLPSTIAVRLLGDGLVEVKTTAPPSG